MSTVPPNSIYIGPFARIVAISLSTNIRYDFRFTRDDGTIFTPDLNENLDFAIFDLSDKLICSCESRNLDYEEEETGLVASLTYELGYYRLNLDMAKIQEFTGLTREDFQCVMVTRGDKTLETFHDRSYLPEIAATLLKPGCHHITVPYWYTAAENTYPSLKRTDKQTTHQSSIPFKTSLKLWEVQGLANFQMERLGVAWNPTPELTGWVGSFDIRDVCTGGTVSGPWQLPVGVEPPAEIPTSHMERRYVVYEQVTVKLAVSACPGGWNQMDLSIGTDVGFSHYLPYQPPGADPVDISHNLGDFGKNMAGKSFTMSGELVWNGGDFTYSTGENPIYANQTATLVQSPALDFDLFAFEPLAEQV